jgi:hypothetical protein
VWFNLRVEPVVYVNDLPFAPRDKHDLNNNLRLSNTVALPNAVI